MDKANLEEEAKLKLDPIPAGIHLSVDEVSYRKYHRYLTNVIDTDRKLVIWNEKGHKAEILDKYCLIVYDKFHLIQKLNNTVDAVRKIELQKDRNQK